MPQDQDSTVFDLNEGLTFFDWPKDENKEAAPVNPAQTKVNTEATDQAEKVEFGEGKQPVYSTFA